MHKTAILALLATLPALAQSAPAEGTAILEAARLKGEQVAKARAAHVEAGKNSFDFKADVAKDLAGIAAQLGTETRPAVRQALLVAQLYYLRLARQKPSAAQVAMTLKEVPPVFQGWALDKGLLVALGGWAPEAGPYLAQARAQHPDGATRRLLLFEDFTEMLDVSTDAGWMTSYEALQKDFPGSPEAVKAADRMAAERKTAVGAPAPAFSAPALDDPKTVYTLATFKGKYVLMDFWATWCPDCRAEMPGMEKAYARFKGKGLEILSLSFDRKVEHIAPYRKHPETPMAWKHVFLDQGFKNTISEAYGVKSIPKPVLVGPDGRIVATGGQLHGANLEKTLEQFLGK